MQSYFLEDRHSKKYNWLVLSNSPYLKQRNPVNWLEWSPLKRSKKQSGKTSRFLYPSAIRLATGDMSIKVTKIDNQGSLSKSL